MTESVELGVYVLSSDSAISSQKYILDASANNTLSQALNITGIPRFFILDPEGNVISADALRPSSEEIRETLKALTEE